MTSDPIVIELTDEVPTERGYYGFQPSPNCTIGIVYVGSDACHTVTGESFQIVEFPKARWSRRIVVKE